MFQPFVTADIYRFAGPKPAPHALKHHPPQDSLEDFFPFFVELPEAVQGKLEPGNVVPFLKLLLRHWVRVGLIQPFGKGLITLGDVRGPLQ